MMENFNYPVSAGGENDALIDILNRFHYQLTFMLGLDEEGGYGEDFGGFINKEDLAGLLPEYEEIAQICKEIAATYEKGAALKQYEQYYG